MITDNTAKWRVKKVTEFIGNSLPIGHFYHTIATTVPAGSLPLFGGLYSRALYADLWNWIQQSNMLVSETEWQSIASTNKGIVTKFSTGDGSTTFRVPNLPTTITGDIPSEVPVVGNGMTLGMTNGTTNFGLAGSNSNYSQSYTCTGIYGVPVGSDASNDASYITGRLGVTTDASKSGIVAKMSSTKTDGMWCVVAYGTVSNVGNADVANVMQAVTTAQTVASEANNKIVGISDYIIESYRNGTEWYEVYRSGKVRQGGQVAQTTSGGGALDKTVTLLKKMANTNYYASVVHYRNSINEQYDSFYNAKIERRVATLEVHLAAVNSSQFINGFCWIVEGQGA